MIAARHMPAAAVCFLVLAAGAAQAEECQPLVEENERWQVAHLRAHKHQLIDCKVSAAAYAEVLGKWIAKRGSDKPIPESLFLGRLVDYPWLSELLARSAREHPGLPGARSNPRKINNFVRSILESPEMLPELAKPFAGSRFRVASVSVEKVLVGPINDVLNSASRDQEKVPFDAQVWLVLTDG